MVTIKSDLEIIKMYWNGKTYQIKAEEIKDTDKQDIEMTYASDSHDPNEVTFGKCEYSIDLSGVQSHRYLFLHIREKQKARSDFASLPNLTTFKYAADGKVVVDKVFRAVFVEEISGTNNEPFDVKLKAVTRVYRDAKNELY